MKWSRDGDQICITKDDFVDLQTSAAVFVPRDSEIGRHLENGGMFCELPLGDLMRIRDELDSSETPALAYEYGRNRLFKT